MVKMADFICILGNETNLGNPPKLESVPILKCLVECVPFVN